MIRSRKRFGIFPHTFSTSSEGLGRVQSSENYYGGLATASTPVAPAPECKLTVPAFWQAPLSSEAARKFSDETLAEHIAMLSAETEGTCRPEDGAAFSSCTQGFSR